MINHGLTLQSWDWWSSQGVRPPPSPRGHRGPSSPQWRPSLPRRPLSGSPSQGRQTWPLTSLPGNFIRKTHILFPPLCYLFSITLQTYWFFIKIRNNICIYWTRDVYTNWLGIFYIRHVHFSNYHLNLDKFFKLCLIPVKYVVFY